MIYQQYSINLELTVDNYGKVRALSTRTCYQQVLIMKIRQISTIYSQSG